MEGHRVKQNRQSQQQQQYPAPHGHQPLFKSMIPSQQQNSNSAAVLEHQYNQVTKGGGNGLVGHQRQANVVSMSSHQNSFKNFKTQHLVDNLQQNSTDNFSGSAKRRGHAGGLSSSCKGKAPALLAGDSTNSGKNSVGGNLKTYLGKRALNRVPSQIINNPALHHTMQHEQQMGGSIGGGHQQTRYSIDESYESTNKHEKYKIEYHPKKQNTITRKQSKVNTLVNSLMNSSSSNTNTNNHLMISQQTTSAQSKILRGSPQKKHSKLQQQLKGNHRNVQKSLDSPIRKDSSKAANLMLGGSTEQSQTTTSLRKLPGTGPKKRQFYNSMVVAGNLPKETHTSKNNNSQKVSMDEHMLYQQMYGGTRELGSKQNQRQQHSASRKEASAVATTHGNNTPNRLKSRQNRKIQQNQLQLQQHQQQQQQQQQYHQVFQPNESQPNSALRSSLGGSIGMRSNKQTAINPNANNSNNAHATISTSQLHQNNVILTTQSSGDYQLNAFMGHQQMMLQSPQKTTPKLYNSNVMLNRSSAHKQKAKVQYIPIKSGTYVLPNESRLSMASSTQGKSQLQYEAPEQQQNGFYEVTPLKNHIAKQSVKNINNKQQIQQQQQQENSKQQQASASGSSYYLVHGKYNNNSGKASTVKQKSSSVKATDLGLAATNQDSFKTVKNSQMNMPQITNQQIISTKQGGKAGPKSHSHGLSTPTTVQSMMMNLTQPKDNTGIHHNHQGSVTVTNKAIQLNSNNKLAPQKPQQAIQKPTKQKSINKLKNAADTASRLYETTNPTVASLMYNSQGGNGAGAKTMPGSSSNTKRNSIASNLNENLATTEKQSKISKTKGADHQRLLKKNSDQQNCTTMSSSKQMIKQQQQSSSLNKRKNAPYSLTQGNNSLSESAYNLGLRTMQQSIDKPAEKLLKQQMIMTTTNGSNSKFVASQQQCLSGMANHGITSPSHNSKNSVRNNTKQSSSKRSSHASSNIVNRESIERQQQLLDSMSQSKQEGFFGQLKDGSSSQQLQIKQMKGVNQSSDAQNNNEQRQTPSLHKEYRKATGGKGNKMQQSTILKIQQPVLSLQPRILSKTSKNSNATSKENLHRLSGAGIGAGNSGSGVSQVQGQVLLNQYVSSKKRGLRRNISKDEITSVERSSAMAEAMFLQNGTNGKQSNNVVPSTLQKQKMATNPAKYPKGHQVQLKMKQKQPSFASLESLNVQTQLTQSSLSSDYQHQLTQGSVQTQSQDGLPKLSNANNLMIQEQEEDGEQTPDRLSPRQHEVALLTKVITDCFEKYNKMPKTRIELYRVGKMLGKGAFGKVNLGLHRLTRKLVAIKSTDKDQIKEESMKRKFLQEIDILKSIRHTSHIKLMETFQTANHYLIVMELCPGGDLLNYVRKRRKLTETNAKYLFKQIMQGIAYMHTIGIVHRDIKLDNILLDGHGNVKIGDFGVSRRVDKDELLFEQCGTPAYIAPEIVEEIGYKGFPVDIWSAGVCLYAILYGNVPFKANQIGDLTHELYQQEIEYRDTVSELSRDLMQNMLEKNPKKRLTAKEVLFHPWFDDIEEQNNIFDEQEKNLMRKEFTYILQKQRLLKENDDRDPYGLNTEFTEHSIGANSENELLKNNSTRSVILCPFNSRQADVAEQNRLPEYCAPLMEEKDIMLRFGIRVRELDRAYEKFNNQDFDNGVYHKFAYKNQGANKEQNKNGLEELKDDSIESAKKSSSRQIIMQRVLQEAQTMPEQRVTTPESEKYAKVDMNVVNMVSKFGFPKNTIINSLRRNLANHCTSAYYLLLMDQVF